MEEVRNEFKVISDLSAVLAEDTSAEVFCDTIASFLARKLEVSHLLIGYQGGAGEQLQTVAFYRDGLPQPPQQLSLRAMPQQNLNSPTFYYYLKDEPTWSPNDHLLDNHGTQSYLSLPLIGSQGRAVGMLIAMHRGPVPALHLAKDLFRIVSGRLTVELERLSRQQDAAINGQVSPSQTQTIVELLLETSQTIASEVELEKVVQKVTDVATQLSGAEFGAFFYNVENPKGEIYQLYTISGVSREAFSSFPMPRKTQIFSPTFEGQGTVRYDDVTKERHYGQNPPYGGMPAGHLPVRSYLAVPVVSVGNQEVIGGLFLGHPEPGVFTDKIQRLVEGIASQAAIAMGNAKLFAEQQHVQQRLQQSEQRFRHIADNTPVMIWITQPDGQCVYLNKQWYDFTGQNEENGLGLGWLDAVHPDDSAPSGQVFLEANAAHRDFSLLYRLRDKNGNYRWMIDSGMARFSPTTGEFEGYIGAVVDVHEQKLAEDALAEQKKQYESIFNATSDAILIFDFDGNLVACNPAAHVMHGYAHDEFVGLHGTAFIHPNDQHKFGDFVRTVKAGKRFTVEGTHLRKDGSPLDIEVVGSQFVYRGKPHLLAVVRDVSERKESERALKKQSLLIKTITDNTTQALFMMDDRQVCTFMNPAAEKMTGFRVDEVQAKPLHYYVHHTYPDGRHFPMEECEIDRALPTKAQTQGEEVFVHRDGHFYPVAFTASPIIEDGTPIGTVIEVRDISGEKAQQAALRHSEETLRLTVASTQMGTWDFNPKTGALVWSDRCKELFGLPPDAEVDYDVFLAGLHPEDRDYTHAAVQHSFNPESGGKYSIEYRTIGLQDGIERWIRATGKAFFDRYGQAVRFIGTVQDITTQRRNQSELEEKTRQLEYANEDLKNFTYTISHDIKGPLSNLLMAAEMAEDLPTVDEVRPLLGMISQSGQRINDILQGLIKIIREEETKGKVEQIDLPQLLGEVIEEVKDDLEASQGEIELDVRVREIHFIRSYLQSILRNLLDNAVKYRQPGRPPHISLGVRPQAGLTEFTIRDNGRGIDLQRYGQDLFQPFQRFAAEQPGTGIGLFMIRRMIEKHGGSITVESEPDQGTTFYFTIPNGLQFS